MAVYINEALPCFGSQTFRPRLVHLRIYRLNPVHFLFQPPPIHSATLTELDASLPFRGHEHADVSGQELKHASGLKAFKVVTSTGDDTF